MHPPPPTTSGISGGAIPLERRYLLAASYCLAQWFAGQSVTAAGMLVGVDDFRSHYRTANALGLLLGKGVGGHGFNLYKRHGSYPPIYSNGWQLAQKLAPDVAAGVAERLGLASVDALVNAIRGLADNAT
jgi:hypothetical protein